MSEGKSNEEKIIKIQSPEGVHDILPGDHEYFSLIKKVVRYRARQAGFRRITPPVFEFKDLFVRSIGDDTDVVDKELYTFSTPSGKTYALRPELTAGIARAYIEHGMINLPQPVHFYSFESVFRHDRPQKGRFRQFHQFNIEVIGESDPGIDAQIIHMAWQILRDLKIEKGIVVRINSLGSKKERKKYIEDLRNYFEGRKRALCENCIKRLEKNPLRLLDCKNEDCALIGMKAPSMKTYLSEDDKAYHKEVLDLLDTVGVPYEEDEKLVRGLDYYCRTIFEFVEKGNTKSQNTIIGGGAYDGLISLLGGEENVPGIGYAMGIERAVERMKELGVKTPTKDVIHVFVAQIGSHAKLKALPLIEKLQSLGIHTMGAVGKSSIKGQMRMADRFGAWYSLIMGQIEVRDGTIILRDMRRGSQEIMPFEEAIPKILELVGEKNIDKAKFLEEIYLDPPKPGDENEAQKFQPEDLKCRFN